MENTVVKIENLVKVYKAMLSKEEKIIAETKGTVSGYDKWKEAVNASSCYRVIVKDLESLLREAAKEEKK